MRPNVYITCYSGGIVFMKYKLFVYYLLLNYYNIFGDHLCNKKMARHHLVMLRSCGEAGPFCDRKRKCLTLQIFNNQQKLDCGWLGLISMNLSNLLFFRSRNIFESFFLVYERTNYNENTFTISLFNFNVTR